MPSSDLIELLVKLYYEHGRQAESMLEILGISDEVIRAKCILVHVGREHAELADGTITYSPKSSHLYSKALEKFRSGANGIRSSKAIKITPREFGFQVTYKGHHDYWVRFKEAT